VERSPAERATDHAAIDGLTQGLLPALMAKLSATGLGELEVREGAWRVRLRRPADGGVRDKRAVDRAARTAAGHHAPPPTTQTLTPVGPGRDGRDGTAGAGADRRVVATSPAVGIFQVASDRRAGTRVRAGDRLGAVDMLGVAQEVVAPMDGVVGASLAESGDAVEYGQDLVVIEFASASALGPEA
jgi:acetyl-CoA carboxylase biotin carboxyl carrier protein